MTTSLWSSATDLLRYQLFQMTAVGLEKGHQITHYSVLIRQNQSHLIVAGNHSFLFCNGGKICGYEGGMRHQEDCPISS